MADITITVEPRAVPEIQVPAPTVPDVLVGGAVWSEILGKPTGSASAPHFVWDGNEWVPGKVAWSDLSGVPATFPPSAHGHDWGDLTSVPPYASRWPDWTEVANTPPQLPGSPSDGQFASWDAGAGQWVAVDAPGGSPGGADGQIQYNDDGAFGGLEKLVYSDSNGVLRTTGAANDFIEITPEQGFSFAKINAGPAVNGWFFSVNNQTTLIIEEGVVRASTNAPLQFGKASPDSIRIDRFYGKDTLDIEMAANREALLMQGSSGQTADILKYLGSGGSRLAAIGADGTIEGSGFSVGGTEGASGSFTTTDGKTVTVDSGIITAIT